jgi:N-acetylglucosaminyl-diphospho-decaprenol L-rhamnosyltransferase
MAARHTYTRVGKLTDKEIDVSIIIVTYNVEKTILACLESVFANDLDLSKEVIVVDNHSRDHTVDQVNIRFSKACVLIENNENRGFSVANNQAITIAKGRYMFLLNPDAEVVDHAISKLVSFMDLHPAVGICGPRIYNSDMTIQGSARGFPDFTTGLFGRASFLTRVFPRNPLSRKNVPFSNPDVDEPQQVDWVSGAAMLVRRDALEQIGRFSEDFFLFWEDADLCYRMKLAGFTTWYCPQAKVIHRVGESVRSERVRSIIEFHKSAYLWYRKHRVQSSWGLMRFVAITGLFARMIFQLIGCFLLKLRGK